MKQFYKGNTLFSEHMRNNCAGVRKNNEGRRTTPNSDYNRQNNGCMTLNSGGYTAIKERTTAKEWRCNTK